MSQINGQEFNSLFSEAINRGGESLEKAAEVTGLYIQDKLRENAFSRKILPPQTVTTAELTRRVDDEGFSYIDDLEPDSLAMQINMRGEPTKTYIEGKRYEIRFTTISSDEFTKAEAELRSYRMPITKILEQNTVKDIQEQEDKIFMDHVRVGLMLSTRHRMNTLIDREQVIHTGDLSTGSSYSGRNFESGLAFASYLFTRAVDDDEGGATGSGGFSPSPGPGGAWTLSGTGATNYNPANGNFSNIIMSEEEQFTRTVLRDVVKVQAAREMKARVFLLHEYDWTDTVGWLDSEAGLEITAEIVRDGYKYTTVGGYTFVTTVRDNPDIVQPGQIYTFPAPEFLGRFLLLESTKFFIDKRARFVNMQAWEECGMGFGNIKGLGLILLRGASIELPRIWQDSSDTAISGGTVGTFTLTNDPADPISNDS